jgi:hypothetical protein
MNRIGALHTIEVAALYTPGDEHGSYSLRSAIEHYEATYGPVPLDELIPEWIRPLVATTAKSAPVADGPSAQAQAPVLGAGAGATSIP